MDGMLDCEFQWGRLRMGLFCRELLPPPASAQLPVLGKRLWLLQTRGHQAGHCQDTTGPLPRGPPRTAPPLARIPVVLSHHPRSGWGSPSLIPMVVRDKHPHQLCSVSSLPSTKFLFSSRRIFTCLDSHWEL